MLLFTDKSPLPISPASALLAGVIALLAASPLSAQPKPKPPVSPKPATAATAGATAEEKLISEMAGRNMDKLLDYYFTKNNTPQVVRDQSLISKYLSQLLSEDYKKLPADKQRKIIDSVVGGIDRQLPNMSDPTVLMKISVALVKAQEGYLNALEYWGENAQTQALMRPIADATDKVLQKAGDQWHAKQDEILKINPRQNDPRLALVEQYQNNETASRYNQMLARYALALSMDKAADRAKVCDQALDFLKDYDDPDSATPAQLGQVRTYEAKLNMVKGGKEGYAVAAELFDKVITDSKAELGDQYTCRYFKAVNSLLARKLDAAQKQEEELVVWQAANVGKEDPGANEEAKKAAKLAREGVEAASAMLQYRVLTARADAETDKDKKDKLKSDSVALLLDLVTKRPELRRVIFEQLTQSLPDDSTKFKPDQLKTWDMLTLEALVQKGIEAATREQALKDDPKWIDRATDGAREIIARKGMPGSSAKATDTAAFRLGILEEKLGSMMETSKQERTGNTLDAVEAYLDYTEKFAGDKIQAQQTLDRALYLIRELRKDPEARSEDRAVKLYDRSLEMAVAKGHKEYVFSLADRRREQERYQEAANLYASIPDSGVVMVNVMKRYREMFCQRQHLADATEKPTEAQKTAIAARMQELADQIGKLVDDNIKSAPDEKIRLQMWNVSVQTMLIAADLARGGKQWQRVLDLLKPAEPRLQNLPEAEAKALQGEILQLRVTALMGLNKTEEAMASLKDLVKNKGKSAFDTIATLADKVNEQYKQARRDHDTAGQKQLSDERAELAKLLVDQLKEDPNNPHRKEYLIFNAAAQVDAAELTDDAAKKDQYLNEATNTYTELLKAQPDDRTLLFHQGQVYFAQKKWDKAYDTFGDLFQRKRFGKPQESATDPITHAETIKPNPLYWELFYKLLRTSVELAKQDPNSEHSKALMDATATALRRQVIEWGDNLGFDQKDNFQQLRREVLGDWKPEMGTTQPTTTPIAH